jgi:hypothetical protein
MKRIQIKVTKQAGPTLELDLRTPSGRLLPFDQIHPRP